MQYTADSDENAPVSCTFSSLVVDVCLPEMLSEHDRKKRRENQPDGGAAGRLVLSETSAFANVPALMRSGARTALTSCTTMMAEM